MKCVLCSAGVTCLFVDPFSLCVRFSSILECKFNFWVIASSPRLENLHSLYFFTYCIYKTFNDVMTWEVQRSSAARRPASLTDHVQWVTTCARRSAACDRSIQVSLPVPESSMWGRFRRKREKLMHEWSDWSVQSHARTECSRRLEKSPRGLP